LTPGPQGEEDVGNIDPWSALTARVIWVASMGEDDDVDYGRWDNQL